MKKYKLSPWHDGSVKPVHVGVYQKVSEGDSTVWYAYWNGEQFSAGNFFLDRGGPWNCFSHYKVKKWRGILKD